jgi:cell division protein FtsB
MKKEYLNPLRWNRTILLSVFLAFIALWFLFIDSYSLLTRFQLESRKQELIERTAEYQVMTEELKVKINALENNPHLLEKIAREEYGMRKPGEVVYRIEPEE